METTSPPDNPWRTIPSHTLPREMCHPTPDSMIFLALVIHFPCIFCSQRCTEATQILYKDLGGHTIQDSTHFSSCISLIRFYWEVSAVSCLQSQHKSATKPHHAHSYCAKLNPGVSTRSLQPWLAVIPWAQRETFVILPEIFYTITLVKTTGGVSQHIFIAVSVSIVT